MTSWWRPMGPLRHRSVSSVTNSVTTLMSEVMNDIHFVFYSCIVMAHSLPLFFLFVRLPNFFFFAFLFLGFAIPSSGSSPPYLWRIEHILKGDIPHCKVCEGLVKPTITFFGGNLPERFGTLVLPVSPSFVPLYWFLFLFRTI